MAGLESFEKEYRRYGCPVCQTEVKVDVMEDPSYWFYQVKSTPTIRYTTDYAFCSKECMNKYLRRKNRNYSK